MAYFPFMETMPGKQRDGKVSQNRSDLIGFYLVTLIYPPDLTKPRKAQYGRGFLRGCLSELCFL
jgi:hypothetical protein